MPSGIKYDDLLVCDDCAMILANEEFDGDCEHGNSITHHAVMFKRWGEMTQTMVLACDEQGRGSCVDFSRRDCDGCGSALAGARHPAAVLELSVTESPHDYGYYEEN